MRFEDLLGVTPPSWRRARRKERAEGVGVGGKDIGIVLKRNRGGTMNGEMV